MSAKTIRLRQLLGGDECLVAPGAYDAMTARLIQEAGFEVAYLTGFGISISTLGAPDLGLLTQTEMAQRGAYVANAIEIPVIADADTGYGNVINVRRTVQDYERAGIAAMQLEDQVMPKRCGHMAGKQVISAEEMVGKIRMAVDSRTDPDFLIIARTDARSVNGLDDALRRGDLYARAGADVLFIEAPQGIEEMRRIATAFRGVPLMANMVERGATPPLSAAELHDIGYRIAIFPISLLLRFVTTGLELLATLRREGTTRSVADSIYPFDGVNRMFGLGRFSELEKMYSPTASQVIAK